MEITAEKAPRSTRDPTGANSPFPYEEIAAALLEREVSLPLNAEGQLVRACGEAVERDILKSASDPSWRLVDTLKDPGLIGLNASQGRLKLIEDANVLDIGLDASHSVQAENSLEKMLVHQMAAAHNVAMRLMARVADAPLPPVEMARLLNSIARMMEAYRAGFLTLHKIRTGGKQTVVVQHVQVSDGGQAVIAGNVAGRGQGKLGGP